MRLKLIKFEEKSQLMDCSVYKEYKHTVAYGTRCCVWDTT